MIVRGLSAVMCVLFLISVAVQYNDPDPIHWMILYGIAAVVSGMAVFGRFTGFSWLAVLGFVAFALYIAPKAVEPWTLVAHSPDEYTAEAWEPVERAREAGGLLICAFWMTVLGFVWFRKQHGVAPGEAASPTPSAD